MARDFLKEVFLEKQKSVKEAKRRYPEEELRLKLEEPHIYRPFKSAISQSGRINIIGEIKKASPSEGILREDFDPIQISRIYQNIGCSAISVLTEGKYFSGKISYLSQVRKIVTMPILRKDFIFDIYQLYESKFFGADCVLLIAELLKGGKLAEFLSVAKRIELDCLVEVNNIDDLHYALDQGSEILGINNRNMHSLEVNNKLGLSLINQVPRDKVIVLESGIKSHRDYLSYSKFNLNAILIGSAFMKAQDIKQKFEEIVKGPEKKKDKKVKTPRRKPSKKAGIRKRNIRK